VPKKGLGLEPVGWRQNPPAKSRAASRDLGSYGLNEALFLITGNITHVVPPCRNVAPDG
jgi:hypothetical protein